LNTILKKSHRKFKSDVFGSFDNEGDITGIIKSRSTSLLDHDSNNCQIIFNNAITAGFDNNRIMALKTLLAIRKISPTMTFARLIVEKRIV
jgi:hypothetical protein